MDNCNKWQKRKLQKYAKRMYRICFDLTRRYINFTARNSDKPVLKLARSEGIKRGIICWLPWKRCLPVVTVFLEKHKDSGTRNYV